MRSRSVSSRPFFLVALGLIVPVVAGCKVTGIAAGVASSISIESKPHMRGFWDYEIAGQGTAAGIMQLESMYSIRPDDEELALTLCAADMGYAFGWVEVDAERAEDAGDYKTAERHRHRAALLYKRARDIALGVLRRRDDRIDKMLQAKPAALKAYLADHYDDREDAAPLFWTAAAWGGLMGASDDLSMAVDLPPVIAMVERVVALDEGFENGGALVFLASFNSQFPAQFGGSPAKGKEYFERALKLTGRRAHQVQLSYARFYALTQNDQALFVSLLNEIIEAPDQGSPVRMANKIARIRAERLLAKVDQLF